MAFTFESFEMRRRAIAFADGMLGVADTLTHKLQCSLREQLRRAALSVPCNLARGCGCTSAQERRDFYRIAKGAVYEVISLLVLMAKQGYLGRESYRQFCEEADRIAAMITSAMGMSPVEEQAPELVPELVPELEGSTEAV